MLGNLLVVGIGYVGSIFGVVRSFRSMLQVIMGFLDIIGRNAAFITYGVHFPINPATSVDERPSFSTCNMISAYNDFGRIYHLPFLAVYLSEKTHES